MPAAAAAWMAQWTTITPAFMGLAIIIYIMFYFCSADPSFVNKDLGQRSAEPFSLGVLGVQCHGVTLI